MSFYKNSGPKDYFSRYKSKAWEQFGMRKLNPSTALVLLYLLCSNNIQEHNNALKFRNNARVLRQASVVRETGLNRSTVCRAFKELESFGILDHRVEQNPMTKNDTTVYYINPDVVEVGRPLSVKERTERDKRIPPFKGNVAQMQQMIPKNCTEETYINGDIP